MSAIEIYGLNVWFGTVHDRIDAVRDATLTVAKGESFGLVGESGSGKSTILRAITGLRPTGRGISSLTEPLSQAASATGIFSEMCRWCFKIPMPRSIRARPLIAC